MFKNNLRVCLCGLALTNCNGYVQLKNENILEGNYNNMVIGEIVRPNETMAIRTSTDIRNISSVLNYNDETETSLTLVVMDSICGEDYNNWLEANLSRIKSSDMVKGAIIHQISHNANIEFVIVIDEDQLSNWRIDLERFNLERSKAILFGSRSYRFKRMLMSIFNQQRVFIPKEGCNLQNNHIAQSENWTNN